MKNRMKRVLVFDTFSRIGGGLAFLTNVADTLSEGKPKWEWVFYCNPVIRNRLSGLEKNAEVHYGPVHLSKGGLKGYFLRKKVLKDAIVATRPDIVISMNQLDLKTDIPSILFLRNLLYFAVKDPGLKRIYPLKEKLRCNYLRMATLKSISRADHIVTATDAFKHVILQSVKNKNIQGSVIPFGLNRTTLSDCRREYYRNTCEILFLQLNFYKGLDIAVYALKRLLDMGYDARLTITDDSQKIKKLRIGKIKDSIKKLELSGRIVFTGLLAQTELQNLYLKADVFWFPSYIESFGHGLLEAMANGLPCIATNIGAFKEIGGDSIRYFELGDDKSLAMQTAALFDKREMCQEYGIRARERSSNFTWSRHLELFELILDKVTNERKS